MSSPSSHHEHLSFEKVWYAAYGSNLFPQRLDWYLNGGKAPTSSHWYAPSADSTPIQARFSGQLPYRLFFARRSLIWGGSKAFIDPAGEPDTGRHAQAAFYLLNRRQFEHVVWQENWQSERPKPLPLDLEALNPRHPAPLRLVPSGYESDYSSLLFCGTARSPDGQDRHTRYPVISFTLHAGLVPRELAPPSRPYVQHIAEGLRQSFPLWDDDDVARYLHSAPGGDSLKLEDILDAVAEHSFVDDPRMAADPGLPLLSLPGG